MIKIQITGLLLITLIFIGCKKAQDGMDGMDGMDGNPNCISASGNIITSHLNLASFNGINLLISDNVTIKQGASQDVKLIGHENVINDIKPDVVDGIWRIEFNNNNCYKNHQLSIEITVPEINNVKLSGSGSIMLENFINQNNLSIENSGSGNISINGFEGISNSTIVLSGSGTIYSNLDINSLTDLTISNSGSGDFIGFNLAPDNCIINSSGSGKSEITVNNDLNVTISGSGNVFYKGMPTITQSITGSGSLIDAN